MSYAKDGDGGSRVGRWKPFVDSRRKGLVLDSEVIKGPTEKKTV